jgi:hypothetical protein
LVRFPQPAGLKKDALNDVVVPVEEAFAAIEKLTDADLNIDNEPDEQV